MERQVTMIHLLMLTPEGRREARYYARSATLGMHGKPTLARYRWLLSLSAELFIRFGHEVQCGPR